MSARNYLLHVPPDYDGRRAWPLVIVLHGAFSRARTMERRSGYSDLADREGFVVAYPNGIGLFGWLQHWNAGHCCGLAEQDHVDDVGFLRYVIEEISAEFNIDAQHIYMVGHSNGAMLAYRFAAENGSLLAGIGIVGGSLGSSRGSGRTVHRTGPPEAPVPLIAIHGRQDRSVPFEGGPGSVLAGRSYIPVVDSVEFWARSVGCEPTPQVREDRQEGQRIMAWKDDAGDTRVVLHVLNDWGHAWPGTARMEQLPQDDPLRTFDASQVIWDFFRECSQGHARTEVTLQDGLRPLAPGAPPRAGGKRQP